MHEQSKHNSQIQRTMCHPATRTYCCCYACHAFMDLAYLPLQNFLCLQWLSMPHDSRSHREHKTRKVSKSQQMWSQKPKPNPGRRTFGFTPCMIFFRLFKGFPKFEKIQEHPVYVLGAVFITMQHNVFFGMLPGWKSTRTVKYKKHGVLSGILASQEAFGVWQKPNNLEHTKENQKGSCFGFLDFFICVSRKPCSG